MSEFVKKEKLHRQHTRSLWRMRRLAEALLIMLEKQVKPKPGANTVPPLGKIFWGEKETRLSVMTKVTQLLLHLIPAERAAVSAQAAEAQPDLATLLGDTIKWGPENVRLLEQFVEQQKRELSLAGNSPPN